MDGRMGVWVDGCVGGCVGGWVCGWMSGWMCGWMGVWVADLLLQCKQDMTVSRIRRKVSSLLTRSGSHTHMF